MNCHLFKEVKNRLPLNLPLLNKILKSAIKELKHKSNFELTVLIVGDKKIKNLNKKFRGKDKVTDVLSFSQSEGRGFILPREGKKYLGEIVICWPQTKRQAKKFGQSEKKELALLIIHGFLHLLGYDDKTIAGWRQMEALQKRILPKI